MSAASFQRQRREAAAKAAPEAVPEAAAPEAITREDIAKMKRPDVVGCLVAHGMSEDQCEGIKVGELREVLIEAMFVNI